ncbi:MAG: hypothetical protein P8X74_04695 [Reinekea sp.]
MLAKNWGAPAIFEKQIEIRLLHPVSTLESRIQVEIKLLHPVSTEESRIQVVITGSADRIQLYAQIISAAFRGFTA